MTAKLTLRDWPNAEQPVVVPWQAGHLDPEHAVVSSLDLESAGAHPGRAVSRAQVKVVLVPWAHDDGEASFVLAMVVSENVLLVVVVGEVFYINVSLLERSAQMRARVFLRARACVHLIQSQVCMAWIHAGCCTDQPVPLRR